MPEVFSKLMHFEGTMQQQDSKISLKDSNALPEQKIHYV